MRFPARVRTAVTGQSTLLSKRFAAVVTAVRPLPGVGPPMVRHRTSGVGGVWAPLALVSAVSADVTVMSLHMSVQTILSQTPVVAVWTVNRAGNTWRKGSGVGWKMWHTERYFGIDS